MCKITEEAYDQLRLEWQEKFRNVELGLAELERDAKVHLDDLDLALGYRRIWWTTASGWRTSKRAPCCKSCSNG